MWKKGDRIYKSEGVCIRDKWYSNPSREQMREAGWTWIEPEPEPVPPPPKRYSKLKIVRKLGERWPEYKAGLEANGLFDQFMAAQFLAEDDPAFAAVYATLTDAEKETLDTECLYE